jgi:F0F1-type ATP synthase delta subunit
MILGVILLQIIVFGVVIYALKKIMLGNTESAVGRLNRSYVEISKKKEKLTKKISQIEEECENQRQQVKEEIKKMREETSQELKKKKHETLQESRKRAEEIINDALSVKEEMRSDIKKEEQIKMINYCECLLKATISSFIQQNINDLFIKEALEGIKEIESDHIPSEINEVSLISAEKLSNDLLSTLKGVIIEKLGRKISFKETINQEIIAGIVVKFGSLVLDQSLATKLQNQSVQMKAEVEES